MIRILLNIRSLVLFLLLIPTLPKAQDIKYARQILDTLCSENMHGRGYVNDGERLAADFIVNEFSSLALKTFGNSYLQCFNMPINTFPDTVEAYIDEVRLLPGKEFVVSSSSKGGEGTYELVWALVDSTGTPRIKDDHGMIDISDKMIVTDMDRKKLGQIENVQSAGIIFLEKNKIWWHVSDGKEVLPYFLLRIHETAISKDAQTITIKVNNRFIPEYTTQNVVAYIEGREYPDSFFVFTAHYDHLGRMGSETYFPGGNDNASGTAMLLDLARYYSEPGNKPEVSIVFIAFGAEETGLCGSSYFAKHPLFALNKIKFLINLDMVGSGSEGIKVVNGTAFEKEFELLSELNEKGNYLQKVSIRGEAPNSDHYPLYEKGVPSFFIYTLGIECKEYHNLDDTPENVPFTAYKKLFLLLLDFVNAF